MNSHHYETLYGVGLLDDLHNYFPAILYQPESFQSVPALLRYVQRQTRNRFDLFSLGQREYQPTVAPPPRSSPTANSSVQLNVSPLDISGNRVNENSILRASRNNITNTISRFLDLPDTTIQYTFEEDDTTQLTSQLLLTLLTGRRGLGMDTFMQPVAVRPTVEEIAANSIIGNLVSDEEHSCAICQDTLNPEQEGRKLNACGHWFHRTCIDTWFERDVHCPVCRHDIREGANQRTPS